MRLLLDAAMIMASPARVTGVSETVEALESLAIENEQEREQTQVHHAGGGQDRARVEVRP